MIEVKTGYNLDMGDFDYLLFGSGITFLVIILNLAGFVAMPFVVWKIAQRLNAKPMPVKVEA